MSIFGDLFQSDVEKMVENATIEFRTEPDWNANSKIWDIVNKQPDAAKDVIKLIRKRINHKTFNVASLTLTLFEAIIKNSGPYFKELVEKKETLDALVLATKHASPKVRDQALTIILSLAEVHSINSRFANYKQVYESMRNSGVPFPARDMNALAPFMTPPPRSNAAPSQPAHPISTQSQRSAGGAASPQFTHPFCTVSKEFTFKVKSEMEITLNYLSIIKETIDAFATMAVSSSHPSVLQTDPGLSASLKLLTEIRSRLARLMAEIDDDLILDVALQVNEAVRSVQEYYKERLANPAKKVDAPLIRVPDAMKKLENRALGKDGKEEEEQERKQKKEEERRNSAIAASAAAQQQAQAAATAAAAASAAPAASPAPAPAPAAQPNLLDFFAAPAAASSNASSSSSSSIAGSSGVGEHHDPFAQLANRADNSSPAAATASASASSSGSLVDFFGSSSSTSPGGSNKNLSTVQTSQVHVSNDELADLLSLANPGGEKK